MSETVMHTELVSAQVVRCWRREMGSGELRSEEGTIKDKMVGWHH